MRNRGANQDQLQRVSTAQVRKWRSCRQLDCRLGASSTSRVSMGIKKRLEGLIRGEGEPKLWRASKNSRRATFVESFESFLTPDSRGAMDQPTIVSLTLSCFHLQPSLDHITRSGEVSRRHTCDGAGYEKLYNTKLLGRALAEPIFLQVRIGWEIDCRKWNIA